jgi:hypothetical protein
VSAAKHSAASQTQAYTKHTCIENEVKGREEREEGREVERGRKRCGERREQGRTGTENVSEGSGK